MHPRFSVSALSPRALHHQANTYRCINQNLQQHGIPSEATVAAVMSMAVHGQLFGRYEKSKVHLDALERMVELRGGLEHFEGTLALLHKLCR